MKANAVSVRRRQIIIAGFSSAALPASVFAGQCTGSAPLEASAAAVLDARADRLIVSGRVVDSACKAIPGVVVHAPHEPSSAVTDADGRFMLVVGPADPSQPLRLVATHGVRGTRIAHVHLARGDHAATARATLEVAFT